MTIKQRVFAGVGVLLLILLITGAFAALATRNLAQTFTEYREVAVGNLKNGQFVESLLEGRLAAVKFRDNRSSAEVEALQEHLAGMRAVQGDVVQLALGTEFEEQITGLDDMISAYEAEFTATVELDAQMKEIEALKLKATEQIDTSLTELLNRVNVGFVTATGTKVLSAQRDFFEAKLAGEQFILNETDTAFLTAVEAIAAVRKDMQVLLEEEGASHGDLIKAALDGITSFETSITGFRDIGAALDARFANMDRLGPEMATITAAFIEALAARQNTLGPKAAQTMSNTIMIVIAVASAGLILGIVLAFATARAIVTPITAMTDTMGEMADGNMEVEVPAGDEKTELGRMALSLGVFQKTALEARALDEEKRRMEKAQAEEKAKADEERHLREEEKSRLAQEEAAKDRAQAQVFDRFRSDIQSVLGAAAAGDFSQRLSQDIENPDLQSLSGIVNQLLTSVEANFSEIQTCMSDLAEGRLDVRIDGDREGAFEDLQIRFNAAVEALATTLGAVTGTSVSVSTTATELDAASREMARRSEKNAAALEETSAAVEEITASIASVVKNAQTADNSTLQARNDAAATRDVTAAAQSAMSEMTDASNKIEKVMGVIEDIAFQINLLALNAGVEAARAGEAGRGFSVVASEVRALAQRSHDAVQEINKVIGFNVQSVDAGVEAVTRSQDALEKIISAVTDVSEQISEITVSVQQQSTGLNEISKSIASLDADAQTNAAAIEELSASSALLTNEATSLDKSLASFEGLGAQTSDATGAPHDAEAA